MGLVEWMAEQAFTNSTAAVCGGGQLVENTVTFLEECCTDDDDPRVRAAALNALVRMHHHDHTRPENGNFFQCS